MLVGQLVSVVFQAFWGGLQWWGVPEWLQDMAPIARTYYHAAVGHSRYLNGYCVQNPHGCNFGEEIGVQGKLRACQAYCDIHVSSCGGYDSHCNGNPNALSSY